MKGREMAEINTWPGWECVKQIGAGSFGKVYEIRREEFGREYRAALKIITIPFNRSEIESAYSEGMDQLSVTKYFQELVENIANEFALMAEFKGHSNIVSYEDHMVVRHEEEIGWDILIRMELLTPLMRWSETHPMKEADVIQLGCDICQALEICQRKNIIHRDVKPENIFVNEYGNYKLGDFGVARTVENTISSLSQKGTYTYIAPEVYFGRPYGAAADIYSLGIVLYRYLNENRAPFLPMGNISYSDRENAFNRRMRGEEIPAPANGSEALKRVVLKAAAYAPEERFSSAAALHRALEECKKEMPSIHGEGKPAGNKCTTGRWILGLAGVFLAGVFIFGAFGFYGMGSKEKNEEGSKDSQETSMKIKEQSDAAVDHDGNDDGNEALENAGKGAAENSDEIENDLQDSVEIPDFEKCEELSTALDMLIVYGVKYDESMQNPDENFWNGFTSALICNSWFDPFSDDNDIDGIWDNEKISAAGSLITGREIACTYFPDGIDTWGNSYSPYLFSSSKVNVHTKLLEKDKFEITYDMVWAPDSLTSINGMIRVVTTVKANPESPLNGYSILTLEHEKISECVYSAEVGTDFDYAVSADNEVIHEKLYELLDGNHTTMDGEDLSEILDTADTKEYAFADINGDSNDDMIVRTHGYWPNFFFYTDAGILWSGSPIGSSAEIWFTEGYLLMGKDSHSSEDVYAVYKIGSDGYFEEVMLLWNFHEENGERFECATGYGQVKEITDEEYEYLTGQLESMKFDLEWTAIP